jgi:rabenosyn-5
MDRLPEFNNLLLSVQTQDPQVIASSPLVQETFRKAAALRKELLDLFAEFDSNSKRINALPAATPSHQRIHSNIFMSANQFLQNHMFTLQLLPKILPASSSVNATPLSASSTAGQQQRNSENEQLLNVLFEQKSQVELYIEDATKKRKFDDVRSLQMNLDEINKEIQRLAI